MIILCITAGKLPQTEEPGRTTVHGIAKSRPSRLLRVQVARLSSFTPCLSLPSHFFFKFTEKVELH